MSIKKVFIVLIGLGLMSCQQEKKEQEVHGDVEALEVTQNFDWLLGQWSRTNEEEGKETFEYWTKKGDLEYEGLTFTMQNNDTTWQENFKLIEINGDWQLEIKSPKEPKPTIFKMTSFGSNQFTCENAELEFPNKIIYWKGKETLAATVSGRDLEILFEYQLL